MAVTHARRQAALGGIIWNSFEASFVTADERRRFIDEFKMMAKNGFPFPIIIFS